MNKFNVGDKVKVVKCGHGFNDDECGSVVTISEIGFGTYITGEWAYKIEEGIGNNIDPMMCRGWHGEISFELVEKYTPNETIPPEVVVLGDKLVQTQTEWTDKHYDNNYTLTQQDIERGFVKVDPYFVSKIWKIGSKDDSGALWHCFKAIARYGEKNSKEREIRALHAQIKRLAELEGIEL